MFKINSPSVEVRLCRTAIPENRMKTPFYFMDGGWHRCREPYHMTREQGFEGYLLFFSISEGGCVKIDGRLYEIPDNSVTILPPGRGHEYYTAAGGCWIFYWLHIVGENMGFLNSVVAQNGYVFKFQSAGKAGALIEDLFPERFTPDEIAYEIQASRTIAQILHMLLEEVYMQRREKQKKSSVITNMLHDIELHYEKPVHIRQLAERYYISEQHLIRIFKAETGLTPYAYLKKYRLQKAKELLSYSELTIGGIAARTGFSDNNNFIYQFRQEYGLSPGEYRKAYKA